MILRTMLNLTHVNIEESEEIPWSDLVKDPDNFSPNGIK